MKRRPVRRSPEPAEGADDFMVGIAADGVDVAFSQDGQDWRVAWFPPPDAPPGTPHGAAGICVAGDQVVLIGTDGEIWGLPGGRPEPSESMLDTLRREVREEACAVVRSARLLGFSRGTCVRGHEAGLVLVRSMWRAEVVVEPWEPRFEITHRRLVPDAEAFAWLEMPSGLRPLHRRAFAEAGLPATDHGNSSDTA
jgi:ADP-ribose pyrophosphatase YjhB (NUDIX family)